MEYNFLNWMFFVGLLGGGIPWALLFADGRHNSLQRKLLWIQKGCLTLAAGNLMYGLAVVIF